MGSLSIWHWLVVLVIVLLIFGTKKVKNIGEDLGSAIKGFKKGMEDANEKPEKPASAPQQVGMAEQGRTIDVTATAETEKH